MLAKKPFAKCEAVGSGSRTVRGRSSNLHTPAKNPPLVSWMQAYIACLLSRLCQEQQPQIAVVVSTLVIAALFNPLRRRIQSVIDRRFYRRKYDARKTLEAFSAKIRDETDLDALSEDLVEVVRETMQPVYVSLWLRPDSVPKGSEGPE